MIVIARSAFQRRSNLLAFLLFLFPSLCRADISPPQVCHKDNCVAVEVVSKPEDLERGLMFRAGLDQDKGMLFVFGRDDIYKFWMKNMKFNLDILWINKDGNIVFIGQNVPACRDAQCPIYSPEKEARYVLELQGGYTASQLWKQGDKLEFKGI